MQDSSEALCPSCQKINLDSLFGQIPYTASLEKEPVLILERKLGWRDSTCPLCVFFFEMLADEERESSDTVFIFRSCSAQRNGATNSSLNTGKFDTRTALLPTTKQGVQITWNKPLINYSKAPEVPVLIDSTRVDYPALVTWVEKARRFERDPVETLPVSVIDCHTREIIAVQGPLDYVALSYVWGATVQQAAPDSKILPLHLPRTVEDAMAVVRELGLRYLWVDRYCLDQMNKAEFQTQLNLMADIYRHALMTIIGAAGSNADYGLPGVGSRPRIKQPSIRLGDYTLWSSMSDPRDVVKKSKWMTRAWTHQEGVFSWNWIAFTDEQVFFQRSNKELANMERGWKTSSEMFPYGGLGADANCPLLQMFDNIWANEGAVHMLLAQYTARSLTYQMDALNGALGLLKRCGNGPYPMNHYFGIPVLGPLVSHRKAMGRDLSRTWTLTEALLAGLCWTSNGSGQRRPGFPSWSWTGWQAIYRKPTWCFLYQGPSYKSSITAKLSVKTAEVLMDWETMCNTRNWDIHEDLTSLPQELYIQAPTIPLIICQDPRSAGGPVYGHAAKADRMKWCAIFTAQDCDILVEVDIVDEAVDAALLDSESILLKGILLRKIDLEKVKDSPERGINEVWVFALIVREDEDGMTRVGSLELRADNYFARWREQIHHTTTKTDNYWLHSNLIEYEDCAECRVVAMEAIVKEQQDDVTKVV